MTNLLELKEKLRSFYGKYDIYIQPLLKFILAFGIFAVINKNLGFMQKISTLPVELILALICAILPINTMLVLAAAFIVVQLYALSLEVAAVALGLFAVMFLLYFRFVPGDGVYTLLTPLCCYLHIGPVIPLAAGLLGKINTVLSVVCGTVTYFFLHGVKENAALLGTSEGDAAASAAKFSAVFNQLTDNKEMYLVLIAFIIVTVLVFAIRKSPIDHAWTVAIVIGALMNFIILFAGYLMFHIKGRLTGLIIGTAVSAAAALLLEFLFFNVDYTRTERVQFEDDEYYYYVKAVPKIKVPEKEKQVKKFVAKKKLSQDTERFTKKQLSEDFGISEDLLK